MSTPAPSTAPRRTSTAVLGVLVAVGTLLVVAVTVGAGAWLYVDRPWLERGETDEVLELEYATPIAEVDPLLDDGEVDVALPVGSYSLHLASAARLGEADLADDRGSGDRAAPEGQEYLTVGWSFALTPRRGADIGSPISMRPERGPRELPSPYLTVRDAATGDVLGPERLFESAEVEPFPDDVPDAVAIAVPDDVDVVVDVTFDGQVQRIDGASGEIDAGLAAPYYAAMAEDLEADPTERTETRSSTSPRECSVRLEVPRSVTTAAPTCEVADVALAPWTRELGWVGEPGRQWLAVLLDVDTDFAADRGTETLVVRPGGRAEVSLDGREPDAERRVDEVYLEPDPSWSPVTWAVDPDDQGALRAEVPLRMTRAAVGAPPLRGLVVVTADVSPADEDS